MTQPSLLMIRPQKVAHSFVDALAQVLGRPIEAIYSPVVAIEPLVTEIDLSGVSHLVFTSANAVQQFAAQTPDRGLPALCVGKATQKAALQIGLQAIATGKIVANLLAWVRGLSLEEKTSILYLRGQQISFDLLPELQRSGIRAREAILYQQRHCPLSEMALARVKTKPVIIPVFSANSARGLLKSSSLSNAYHTHLVCMSSNIAQEFVDYPSDRLTIAQSPDRAGMIDAVAELL